jgi:tocopherol cyclase
MPRWLWNEYYKGKRKTRRYFEGWYFKQVSADLGEIWSFIPGISRGEKAGEGYSFVQVIEGRSGRTWWFQYPLEDFSASSARLEIKIGKNLFTRAGIRLELQSEENYFRGELGFGPLTPLPLSPLRPNIMGPYAFVPFMECKHGLVSLHHSVSGGFETEGRTVSMGAGGAAGGTGRGYIEKDWGSSMPSSWIWMQSNNFRAEGDSFMLSIADIPWLGSAFTGFLCVGSLGGRILREASYTGARLEKFHLEDGSLSLAIARGRYRLEIGATRSRGGLLRAPVKGLLTRRISESVDAEISLRWLEKGRLLFEGRAPAAGLELVGDPRFLFDRNPAYESPSSLAAASSRLE